MAKKKNAPKNLVKIVDEKGVDHEFELLEIFGVGKQPFAILQPVRGPKGEVTVVKVVTDKKGVPTAFKAPTEKEFQKAIEALDAECSCGDGCESEGCCESGGCGCDCSCEEEKPAKKTATKKKAVAKKAAPKKAAKRAAARA